MEKWVAALVVTAAIFVMGLSAVPAHGLASHVAPGAMPRGPVAPQFALPPRPHVAQSPAPQTGYPRTVLVETFTAEWCIYCEEESQAFYAIDHSSGSSAITISEIHDCYSTSTCGDGYTTSDGTSAARTVYYNVGAFPTVFFDGGHEVLGAAPTLAKMEAWYEGEIANASAFPGNVSIDQVATISAPGTVSVQASVTSAITGTYHALTYLVEYIGTNDSTGHDLGYVVRKSLVDQTVDLTAGTTTQITGTGSILSTWNLHKLGAVTFLQANSTKVVENANFVPVATVKTAVSTNVSTVPAGRNVSVSVMVTNASTSAPAAGLTVTLSSDNGGLLTPATGLTAADGSFSAVFTAPRVTAMTTILLTAQVAQSGYTSGVGTAVVVVNPIIPPGVPTGLSLTPGDNQVTLSWSAPSTGGSGVLYTVYRATSASGPFSTIDVTATTSYVDTGVAAGVSYWYTVGAANSGGVSANATAILASSVLAVSQGLPANVGWWISVDSVTFSSATNGSLAIHIPVGNYNYQFGADSYAYLASEASGVLSVGGAALQFTAVFAPNYATLRGTVHPAGATVTLNGTEVLVANGAFFDVVVPGSYLLKVSSSGYAANSSTITLTPGNTTSVSVELNSLPNSGGAPAGSGLSNGQVTMLVEILVPVGLLGGVAGFLLIRRIGGSRSPPRGGSRTSPPETEPSEES